MSQQGPCRGPTPPKFLEIKPQVVTSALQEGGYGRVAMRAVLGKPGMAGGLSGRLAWVLAGGWVSQVSLEPLRTMCEVVAVRLGHRQDPAPRPRAPAQSGACPTSPWGGRVFSCEGMQAARCLLRVSCAWTCTRPGHPRKDESRGSTGGSFSVSPSLGAVGAVAMRQRAAGSHTLEDCRGGEELPSGHREGTAMSQGLLPDGEAAGPSYSW